MDESSKENNSGPKQEENNVSQGVSRRSFLQRTGAALAGVIGLTALGRAAGSNAQELSPAIPSPIPLPTSVPRELQPIPSPMGTPNPETQVIPTPLPTSVPNVSPAETPAPFVPPLPNLKEAFQLLPTPSTQVTQLTSSVNIPLYLLLGVFVIFIFVKTQLNTSSNS